MPGISPIHVMACGDNWPSMARNRSMIFSLSAFKSWIFSGHGSRLWNLQKIGWHSRVLAETAASSSSWRYMKIYEHASQKPTMLFSRPIQPFPGNSRNFHVFHVQPSTTGRVLSPFCISCNLSRLSANQPMKLGQPTPHLHYSGEVRVSKKWYVYLLSLYHNYSIFIYLGTPKTHEKLRF